MHNFYDRLNQSNEKIHALLGGVDRHIFRPGDTIQMVFIDCHDQ